MEEIPQMSSPIIKKDKEEGVVLLSFPDALKAIIDGFKITKSEWNDESYYGCLHENVLRLHKPDNKYYDWTINDGDLLGEDWYILK